MDLTLAKIAEVLDRPGVRCSAHRVIGRDAYVVAIISKPISVTGSAATLPAAMQDALRKWQRELGSHQAYVAIA